MMTGIEVNSEANFPKLLEYCPSAEGTRAIQGKGRRGRKGKRGDRTTLRTACRKFLATPLLKMSGLTTVWLSGLVVSTLGMGTRPPRFKSRVAPLFHWVATLGKLFTHTASPVYQLQETGVQNGSFWRLSGHGD